MSSRTVAKEEHQDYPGVTHEVIVIALLGEFIERVEEELDFREVVPD